MKPLQTLESSLGHTFDDPSLLKLAVTHPSLAHDKKNRYEDNQRLEFLGDAVLQMTLTLELYRKFPSWQEGDLTKIRAAAVNRKALEQVSKKFQLGDFLLLSKGEENNHGRTKASNLADAMEAVIGALLLDAGYEFTQKWVEQTFAETIESLLEAGDQFNPKGLLQEHLQSRGLPTPTYELISESGPDHQKNYEVQVLSEGEILGAGNGSSKKAAEITAARSALKKLNAAA